MLSCFVAVELMCFGYIYETLEQRNERRLTLKSVADKINTITKRKLQIP